MNKFMLNETSYHGSGAIAAIPQEIKNRGFCKAFVASDPDLVKFGVTAKVTDLLEKENIPYFLYSDIKPNPTIENVQHGVEQLSPMLRRSASSSASTLTTFLRLLSSTPI